MKDHEEEIDIESISLKELRELHTTLSLEVDELEGEIAELKSILSPLRDKLEIASTRLRGLEYADKIQYKLF